jgi:hypothetical protein
MGNRAGGPKAVSNAARANLQMGLNVFDDASGRPKEEAGAIAVDDTDPDVGFIGDWLSAPGNSSGYFAGTRWAYKGKGEARAYFTLTVPKTGMYTVYVYFGPDPAGDHASNVPVNVRYAGGMETKRIDLRQMKGQWVKIGTYKFRSDSQGLIMFTNKADGNVLADAVKLVPVK